MGINAAGRVHCVLKGTLVRHLKRTNKYTNGPNRFHEGLSALPFEMDTVKVDPKHPIVKLVMNFQNMLERTVICIGPTMYDFQCQKLVFLNHKNISGFCQLMLSTDLDLNCYSFSYFQFHFNIKNMKIGNHQIS